MSWSDQDPTQNGKDCGAHSIGIMLALISVGCRDDRKGWLVKPRMACAHDVRLQVLEDLILDLPDVYSTWRQHEAILGDTVLLTEDIKTAFANGIESYYHTDAIRRGLEDVRRRCVECHQTEAMESDEDDASGSDVMEGEPEDDGMDEVDPKVLHDLRKAFPHLKIARQRATVVKAPGKIKGGPAIPLDDTPFERIPPRHWMDFDDYFDAPTLEDQKMFHVDAEG